MKRLLVILANGGIGDVILATPVIKSLREELELDFLSVLVSSYGKDIVTDNPLVDEVILDVHPSDSSKKAPFFYLLRKIKSFNFDGAVILWSTYRFAWLTYLAGIPVRVGQDFRLLYSFLYTHRVNVRTLQGDVTSHWVDCLMDFPKMIGAGHGEPELFIPVAKEAKKEIELLLNSHGVSEKELVIGLHAGRWSDISGLNWPYENFARIGDALISTFGATLVLTGGKNEKELVDKIDSLMKNRPVNLAGKCNLKQLIALIDRCNIFISYDTGPMHIAAALKVPTVAIFALKTDLPARWKPYKTRHVIVRNEECCSDEICLQSKCKHFTCIHKLDVDDILKPVEFLLKEEGIK